MKIQRIRQWLWVLNRRREPENSTAQERILARIERSPRERGAPMETTAKVVLAFWLGVIVGGFGMKYSWSPLAFLYFMGFLVGMAVLCVVLMWLGAAVFVYPGMILVWAWRKARGWFATN